jgi:hypothetical protein
VTTGGGARVAVLDTGIAGSHPEFAGKVASADAVGTSSPLSDPDGHGSHTSGLACAATDNGLGIAGAGFGCRLSVVKLGFNEFGIPDDTIVEAIRVAADRGASTISMSFGGGGPSAALDEAITYEGPPGLLSTYPAPSGPHVRLRQPAVRVPPQRRRRQPLRLPDGNVDGHAPGGRRRRARGGPQPVAERPRPPAADEADGAPRRRLEPRPGLGHPRRRRGHLGGQAHRPRGAELAGQGAQAGPCEARAAACAGACSLVRLGPGAPRRADPVGCPLLRPLHAPRQAPLPASPQRDAATLGDPAPPARAYRFYARARDGSGNREAAPRRADARLVVKRPRKRRR